MPHCLLKFYKTELMKKKMFLVAILFGMGGCDRSPQNYEDCILENMGNVGTEYAAIFIKQACEKKFAEKEPFNFTLKRENQQQ